MLGAASVGALAACWGGRSAGKMAWNEAPQVAAPLASEPTAETRSVVLVALDGVRWQEIFGGVDPELAARAGMAPREVIAADALLPNLYERMVRRGAALGAPGHGAEVRASGPNFISLPGYREMFSGAPDDRCTTNDCAPTDRKTIVDHIRDVSGRDEDVAVLSSWNMIDRAATGRPGRVVVSTGSTAGATRSKARVSERCAALLAEGERAAPWPGGDGYRPDRVTAPLALAYLEDARPRFLFVGLGDPDELAHASDYRGYLGSLQAADRFLGDLFALLDRSGEQGASTTVIVTTDHGRAANFHAHGGRSPESARVFLLAAGGAVPALGYVDAAPGRSLSSVAPTVLGLLGLGDSSGALDEPWLTAGVSPPWGPDARLSVRAR